MNKVISRNVSVDLIKALAVFLVMSVHFFLNTNFYFVPISDNQLYLATTFRTLCMTCVPLFLITTGYLMRKKELSKSYYLSISRVLISYFLYVIVFFLFNYFILHTELSIEFIRNNLLDFNQTGYSWYVEMYIGLFLLIPFLNIIYKNLSGKKEKKILIGTLLLLTSLPGLLNIKHVVTMDYWLTLYPFTYYYIGAYISEYKDDFKISKTFLLFLFSLIISSVLNIYLSHDNNFVWGIHNDWGSIFNVMNSTFLFITILKMDLNKLPNLFKMIIVKVSQLSFVMYLSSYLVDQYIYKIYFNSSITCSLINYIKIIPIIFILSLIISYIINLIYNVIDKFVIKKIFSKLAIK